MQAYYYGISKWRMASSACMMLLSRFKMAQMWNQHTDDTNNLFSCFLTSGICTGRPQTHRAANDSIRKRILRWHSNKNNNKLIIILIVKQIFSCCVEDSDTYLASWFIVNGITEGFFNAFFGKKGKFDTTSKGQNITLWLVSQATISITP